ncbi:MAG: hypothetical protein EXX96DRAFT_582863 [Benjaminiella poitrasii]|nr:MAG: hypothetical protein EXX96DRAFT_582863 [Benjaminiella poitrasii]
MIESSTLVTNHYFSMMLLIISLCSKLFIGMLDFIIIVNTVIIAFNRLWLVTAVFSNMTLFF